MIRYLYKGTEVQLVPGQQFTSHWNVFFPDKSGKRIISINPNKDLQIVDDSQPVPQTVFAPQEAVKVSGKQKADIINLTAQAAKKGKSATSVETPPSPVKLEINNTERTKESPERTNETTRLKTLEEVSEDSKKDNRVSATNKVLINNIENDSSGIYFLSKELPGVGRKAASVILENRPEGGYLDAKSFVSINEVHLDYVNFDSVVGLLEFK